MCFGGSKPAATVTPAAAPAPPLPSGDIGDITMQRKQDNIDNYGTDKPEYRVRRKVNPGDITPGSQIKM